MRLRIRRICVFILFLAIWVATLPLILKAGDSVEQKFIECWLENTAETEKEHQKSTLDIVPSPLSAAEESVLDQRKQKDTNKLVKGIVTGEPQTSSDHLSGPPQVQEDTVHFVRLSVSTPSGDILKSKPGERLPTPATHYYPKYERRFPRDGSAHDVNRLGSDHRNLHDPQPPGLEAKPVEQWTTSDRNIPSASQAYGIDFVQLRNSFSLVAKYILEERKRLPTISSHEAEKNARVRVAREYIGLDGVLEPGMELTYIGQGNYNVVFAVHPQGKGGTTREALQNAAYVLKVFLPKYDLLNPKDRKLIENGLKNHLMASLMIQPFIRNARYNGREFIRANTYERRPQDMQRGYFRTQPRVGPKLVDLVDNVRKRQNSKCDVECQGFFAEWPPELFPEEVLKGEAFRLIEHFLRKTQAPVTRARKLIDSDLFAANSLVVDNEYVGVTESGFDGNHGENLIWDINLKLPVFVDF